MGIEIRQATADGMAEFGIPGGYVYGGAFGDGPHTWQRIRDGRGAKKHLAIGNHDLTGLGRLRIDGFDTIGAVRFVDGDPPPAFTHIPLTCVPEGCVNVHGHTRDETPGATPRINVSVEQFDYRPVALPRLRKLARHLVAGRYPDEAKTHA